MEINDLIGLLGILAVAFIITKTIIFIEKSEMGDYL